jgi:K+-transporting ATPase c subunit
MFGSKSKSISPVETFRRAIDAAIAAADRGVSTNEMTSFLRSRAQLLEDRYYRPNPPTRMHDSSGRLIDFDAKVDAARRERERIANAKDVIPREKRQHAASGYRAP